MQYNVLYNCDARTLVTVTRAVEYTDMELLFTPARRPQMSDEKQTNDGNRSAYQSSLSVILCKTVATGYFECYNTPQYFKYHGESRKTFCFSLFQQKLEAVGDQTRSVNSKYAKIHADF